MTRAGRISTSPRKPTRCSFPDFLYGWLFLKSFGYAALATVLCLAAGYPLALLIARSPRRYRDILVLLVILPFWSNFLIRVYAWMTILGPQSFVMRALNGALGLVGLEPVRSFTRRRRS